MHSSSHFRVQGFCLSIGVEYCSTLRGHSTPAVPVQATQSYVEPMLWHLGSSPIQGKLQKQTKAVVQTTASSRDHNNASVVILLVVDAACLP